MADGMIVQVFTGDAGPVVAKTATTARARSALAREAARLQRARHPGVVEVLSSTEERLELAWVGAHTLETATLPVPAAAAVLAAVAETVADLHAMGIVHGRIEPGHVLLTGDGRPVLCGMVGPEPDDQLTGPADDVGAIGRLMDHLLGPDAEPEPIPERRWSRKSWSGYHRRALQTLADRASHDDLARRPTARALATAIVEVVPDARLQEAPSAELPPRGTDRSIEVDGSNDGSVDENHGSARVREFAPNPLTWSDLKETARLGSDVDHGADDGDASGHGPSSGHGSLAADDLPVGTAPAGAATDAEPGRATSVVPGSGLAEVDGSRPDEEAADADIDALLTSLDAETGPPRPLPRSETFLGLRVEDAAEAGPVHTLPADGGTVDPQPTRSDHRPPPTAPRHPTRMSRSGRTGANPTENRRAALGLAVALLAVVLGAGAILDRSGDEVQALTKPASASSTSGLDGRTAAATSPSTTTATTEDMTPAAPPTASTRQSEAHDGEETEPRSTNPPASPTVPTDPKTTTVTIVEAGTTYAVGEPGDVVEVADWDCDGVTTPGLVRPATGEVFLFDRWATVDEPVVRPPSLTIAGATSLRPPEADGPCLPAVVGYDGRLVYIAASTDGSTSTWKITNQADDAMEVEP